MTKPREELRYVLVGHGRMGGAVDEEARRRGHRRVGRIDSTNPDFSGDELDGADVAFEFTRPEAAEQNVRRCLEAGVTTVCGTTGWEMSEAVREAAVRGPGALVVAANFSLGIQLFLRIVGRASSLAARIGGVEVGVHETHHSGKLDAPSGTAIRLRERIADGLASGGTARPELSVTSARVGAEPGSHSVRLDRGADLILLEHRARDRSGFAEGAVRAAEWLSGKRGLFTFEEIVDDWIGSGRTGSATEEGW